MYRIFDNQCSSNSKCFVFRCCICCRISKLNHISTCTQLILQSEVYIVIVCKRTTFDVRVIDSQILTCLISIKAPITKYRTILSYCNSRSTTTIIFYEFSFTYSQCVEVLVEVDLKTFNNSSFCISCSRCQLRTTTVQSCTSQRLFFQVCIYEVLSLLFCFSKSDLHQLTHYPFTVYLHFNFQNSLTFDSSVLFIDYRDCTAFNIQITHCLIYFTCHETYLLKLKRYIFESKIG